MISAPQVENPGFWQRSFKEAFCNHFGCEPADYERLALAKCFYRHAWPVALVLKRLDKGPILAAMSFIQRAGQARNLKDLLNDLDAYHAWVNLHGGIGTKRLRIRISGERVLKLVRLLNA